MARRHRGAAGDGARLRIVKKVNPNHGGIRTAEERAILFGQTAESIAKAAAAAR